MPRTFTLEEASKLLPTLEPLLRQAVAAHKRLGQFAARMQEAAVAHQDNGGSRERGLNWWATNQLAQEISKLLEQLHGWGCEVKDLEMGLLDFRTLREGREVYLCWRLGEPEIRYWHELDTGFAGRKPL